jgi:hypothetical protein
LTTDRPGDIANDFRANRQIGFPANEAVRVADSHQVLGDRDKDQFC